MENLGTQKSDFEVMVLLIDTIMWPLVFLLFLLIFRKPFTEAIKRIGSFKADGSGIQLSFEKRIEATKKLFQQIKPAMQSKSGYDIQPVSKENTTAYAKILEIHSKVVEDLSRLSEKEHITTTGNPPTLIIEQLKEIGVITIQQAKMTLALLELTDTADTAATASQADNIKILYDKLGLI